MEGKKWKLFEDEEMLDQSLKSSFLNNLALWICVYIHGNSLSLIDCVDWLGPSWGWELFLVYTPFLLCFPRSLYIPSVLLCTLCSFNTIIYLLKKKHKKEFKKQSIHLKVEDRKKGEEVI